MLENGSIMFYIRIVMRKGAQPTHCRKRTLCVKEVHVARLSLATPALERPKAV